MEAKKQTRQYENETSDRVKKETKKEKTGIKQKVDQKQTIKTKTD